MKCLLPTWAEQRHASTNFITDSTKRHEALSWPQVNNGEWGGTFPCVSQPPIEIKQALKQKEQKKRTPSTTSPTSYVWRHIAQCQSRLFHPLCTPGSWTYASDNDKHMKCASARFLWSSEHSTRTSKGQTEQEFTIQATYTDRLLWKRWDSEVYDCERSLHGLTWPSKKRWDVIMIWIQKTVVRPPSKITMMELWEGVYAGATTRVLGSVSLRKKMASNKMTYITRK